MFEFCLLQAVGVDDFASSVSLPTLHYQFSVRKCLEQPSHASVHRDATPVFHLTSILKNQDDANKVLVG